MDMRNRRVGAIIRTNISEQMAANPSLLRVRASHVSKLVEILSAVKEIDDIIIAVPDTPVNRSVKETISGTARWYCGDVHDRAKRMIDCARSEGIEVIVDVSDQYHLDLGEAEKIPSLIRYHLIHDADCTEPVGFLVNTLPRIVNLEALDMIHHMTREWPYYDHLASSDGLRHEYFFAPDGEIDNTARMLFETTNEFKKQILLQAFEKLPGQSGGFLQTATCFQELRGDFERHGLADCSGRHILEIGPNAHLGYGLLFALKGAAKVYLVEKCLQARANVRKVRELIGFYQMVSPYIFENLGIRDLDKAVSAVFRETGNDVRLIESRVAYLCPTDVVDAAIPDSSLDFCLSVSSLEHDDHPAETIKTIFRLLKPGGLTFHTIDLGDHVAKDRPLDFLKYSRQEWDVARHYQPSGRHRYPDYVRMFREAGFMITEVVPKRVMLDPNSLREIVHPEFFSRYTPEDLSVCEMTLWATKP